MNHYDPQKAAQVWQRVQQRTEETAALPQLDLRDLMRSEQYAAAVYAQLARQFSGRSAPLLWQLSQEAQEHLACLKGVQLLLTGESVSLSAPQIPRDSLGTALNKAYSRAYRNLRTYESLPAPQEYAPVFTLLAAENRRHCKTLAALLGNLPQRN